MTDHRQKVYGGVDTHLDVHVAAVINDTGKLLGARSFPTSPLGLRRLERWIVSYGSVARIGVEGTGTYGLGLHQFLTATANPALLELPGVGPDTAAALRITAGDNPDRLRSSAAFAALAGVSPIPASSGKTHGHRLTPADGRKTDLANRRRPLPPTHQRHRPHRTRHRPRHRARPPLPRLARNPPNRLNRT